MNLEDILLRGTRAAQPLASAVPEGILYFVIDEGVIEQTRSSAWVAYSGASLITAGSGRSNLPLVVEAEEPTENYFPIVGPNPGASSGGGSALTVEEIDGTPSVANVTKIKVSNGTLTDDTGGVVTVVTGGGGGGSMPPIVFRPQDNEPPTANFATIDTRNVHPVLDFDDTTDEESIFSGFLPSTYAGGGLTVETYWTCIATTGNFVVDAAIERDDIGGIDIDADSFAAVQSATGAANATSGLITKVDIVFTNGAQMDSLAAGELFRIKIRRDANNASDTLVGDAELLRVVVRET